MTNSSLKAKIKSCKQCGSEFAAFNTLQKVCTPACAIKYSQDTRQQAQDKAYRAETRRRREALKTRSQWLKEAQAAFNRYIRARDYGKPCISSNRPMDWHKRGGAVDAGHYRSTGAAAHLRFNCWNCHAQSVENNRFKSGNVVDYRINLIKRIGQDRVESLETDNAPRSFDIDYLKRVKRIFNKRANHYERLRGLR